MGVLGPAGSARGWRIRRCAARVQLRNASAALAALDSAARALPVAMQDVRRGLAEVELPGASRCCPGRPQVVLDVAHNPQAAAVLAENLGDSGYRRETIAVFGMLRDKDIAGVVRAIAPRITRWHLATLAGPAGRDAAESLPCFAADVKRPGAGIARTRQRRGGVRRSAETKRARMIKSSCSAPSSPLPSA